MLEYLSFEYCKENEESHAITLQFDDEQGDYHLRNYHGRRGLYICGIDGEKRYYVETEKIMPISKLFEMAKIYSWKKSYPPDYIPGEHFMGCDIGSWSMEYKETDKQTTRHIHGKGDICQTFPAPVLLNCVNALFVDFDFMEWISESSDK